VCVTLITQHAKCMRRFKLSSVASLSLLVFPRYLINGTIIRGKFSELEIFVVIFSTTTVWNISHFKKNPATHHKCT